MSAFSRQMLVLAPYGRDAHVLASILRTRAIDPIICPSSDDLISALGSSVGAVVLTNEALAGADLNALGRALDAQPSWSDTPFIILTQRSRADSVAQHRLTARLPHRMTNVIYVERPASAMVLTSAAEAALAGRQRQFQIRDELLTAVETNDRLTRAEATLARSHEELERLVAARTAELRQANQRLLQEARDRLRAEEALMQAQKMEAVGRLTGGIAHDFNNLLMSLVANLELARRKISDTHPGRTFVDHALGATQRGTKLASQLLAFSRTQKLALQPVAVDELVANLIVLARVSMGATQEVQFSPGAPGSFLVADPNQLELALLNLVSNGRDAMPAGGRLTIATYAPRRDGLPSDLAPGDYIELCVSDTGTGIAPEILGRIFEPFFTTKIVGKGTGLGLSQVWGIAHQCGGTVEVHTSPGEGTRFCLFFPVAEQSLVQPKGVPENTQPAAAPRAGRTGIGAGITVLVVDDDDDVRESLVAALTLEEFDVLDARSGALGLPLISSTVPNVLLVDFSMPGMTGAEMARTAQTIRADLPVLMISGYTDTTALDGISNASVLHKPFSIDRLCQMLASLASDINVASGRPV